MRLQAWNIKQLYAEMNNDLQKCNTQLERTMVETICKEEMRELAKTLHRKLTPGEQSILDNL